MVKHVINYKSAYHSSE